MPLKPKLTFFRKSPVPFTLKGGPPLPVFPLLRRGKKLKIAEAAISRTFLYRGTTRCFFYFYFWRDGAMAYAFVIYTIVNSL